MKIKFAISGAHFDGEDFLLKAQNIPEVFDLWDLKEELGEVGVTLEFYKVINTIPYSFGKFLISNKLLLMDETITAKELMLEFQNNIVNNDNLSGLYFVKSKFIKLLGSLDIFCSISFDK